MKINLDFYKKEQEELTAIEEEIIKLINENEKKDYLEIIKKDTRIEILLALSEMRENILNWYPWEENSTILEIEPNFGEITGLLCEKASKVVCLENSLKKAEAIKKRLHEKDNLEVIVGNIENIELQEKFDYITLIGTLERLEKIFSGSIEEYITVIKKFLKPEGKIMVAVDNRLGMKYFSKTDKTGINVTNPIEKKLFNLNELTKILQNTKLVKNKIYYPMPDYQLTNVIYTEEKPLSKNNLSRNITYNGEDAINFYSENQAYREILEDQSNEWELFANSYLLEITNTTLEQQDIKFVSFSNMRKPEYRIKTIMGKEQVYKYALNGRSKEHLEKIKKNIDIMKKSGLNTVDSYEENRIISKYTEAPTLDKVIIKYIKENQEDKAIELMQQFKEELNTKLEKTDSTNNVFDKYNIKYDKADIEKMVFVKNGLWDLIFQNCFYLRDKFYFYDQEWQEQNLPINFILYRAIKYFTRIKKYMTDEKLYEIFQIDKQFIPLFDELDDKIQVVVRDEIMWKLHTQGTEVMDLKRKELTANHQINLLTIENEQNKSLLQQKNKEVEELREALNYVYNSKSWKLTKPLRGILKLGKKRK